MDNFNNVTDPNRTHGQYRPKCLKMVSINVNSIVSNERRYNLINFIKNKKIDIAMINETKLKDKHKIYFKDYNIIRSDRASHNGGGGHCNSVKK